jgi:DNA-directed RNA polymerase specialized sigma24 family protein
MRFGITLRWETSSKMIRHHSNWPGRSFLRLGTAASGTAASSDCAPWLLRLTARTAANLACREAKVRQVDAVSTEEPVPPEPIHDDDEEFYEWYQPEALTRWEDVVDVKVKTPEQAAAALDEITRLLDPRSCKLLLLYEVQGVPIEEVALILGISWREARCLLREARLRIRQYERRTWSTARFF